MNTINLKEIIAPGLNLSEYGSNIQNTFAAINSNFKLLANLDFIKGADGNSIKYTPIKLTTVAGNGRTYMELMEEVISRDLSANVELKPVTYRKSETEVITVNWNDNLKNPNACIYVMIETSDIDAQSPVSSLAFVFLDARFNMGFDKSFVDGDKSISVGEAYEGLVDSSCVLYIELDDSKDNALGWKISKATNWPTLYYDSNVFDFCWLYQGVKTELVARGPKGKDAEMVQNMFMVKVLKPKETGASTKQESRRLIFLIMDPSGEWHNISDYIQNYKKNAWPKINQGSLAVVFEEPNKSDTLKQETDSYKYWISGIIIQNIDETHDDYYVNCSEDTSINSQFNNSMFLDLMKSIDAEGGKSITGYIIPFSPTTKNTGNTKVHAIYATKNATNTDDQYNELNIASLPKYEDIIKNAKEIKSINKLLLIRNDDYTLDVYLSSNILPYDKIPKVYDNNWQICLDNGLISGISINYKFQDVSNIEKFMTELETLVGGNKGICYCWKLTGGKSGYSYLITKTPTIENISELGIFIKIKDDDIIPPSVNENYTFKLEYFYASVFNTSLVEKANLTNGSLNIWNKTSFKAPVNISSKLSCDELYIPGVSLSVNSMFTNIKANQINNDTIITTGELLSKKLYSEIVNQFNSNITGKIEDKNFSYINNVFENNSSKTSQKTTLSQVPFQNIFSITPIIGTGAKVITESNLKNNPNPYLNDLCSQQLNGLNILSGASFGYSQDPYNSITADVYTPYYKLLKNYDAINHAGIKLLVDARDSQIPEISTSTGGYIYKTSKMKGVFIGGYAINSEDAEPKDQNADYRYSTGLKICGVKTPRYGKIGPVGSETLDWLGPKPVGEDSETPFAGYNYSPGKKDKQYIAEMKYPGIALDIWGDAKIKGKLSVVDLKVTNLDVDNFINLNSLNDNVANTIADSDLFKNKFNSIPVTQGFGYTATNIGKINGKIKTSFGINSVCEGNNYCSDTTERGTYITFSSFDEYSKKFKLKIDTYNFRLTPGFTYYIGSYNESPVKLNNPVYNGRYIIYIKSERKISQSEYEYTYRGGSGLAYNVPEWGYQTYAHRLISNGAAWGDNSHVFGNMCSAGGDNSIAAGNSSLAQGPNSMALGMACLSNDVAELSCGLYNYIGSNTRFTVGCGSYSERLSALHIEGKKVYIYGVGGWDGKGNGDDIATALNTKILSLDSSAIDTATEHIDINDLTQLNTMSKAETKKYYVKVGINDIDLGPSKLSGVNIIIPKNSSLILENIKGQDVSDNTSKTILQNITIINDTGVYEHVVRTCYNKTWIVEKADIADMKSLFNK